MFRRFLDASPSPLLVYRGVLRRVRRRRRSWCRGRVPRRGDAGVAASSAWLGLAWRRRSPGVCRRAAMVDLLSAHQ